jgi:hypothetical protein
VLMAALAVELADMAMVMVEVMEAMSISWLI